MTDITDLIVQEVVMFGWLMRWCRPSARVDRDAVPHEGGHPARRSPARGKPTPSRGPAAIPTLDTKDHARAPDTLTWLLDAPRAEPGVLRPIEATALSWIDTVLDAPRLPGGLLPRTAAVIPQLIAMLRQEEPSRKALVQQVARDAVLTAEVLRLVQSPFYRTRNEVDTLDGAIAMLGITGLNAAMARVVLKPVFDTGAGGLTARAAERIWRHADRQAMHCARLATEAGIDRFEGFLAGMMHNTGWTMVLRTLDRAGFRFDQPASTAFVAALNRRRDRLFARLINEWHISPRQVALADALDREDAPTSTDPLARLLAQADRETTAELATAAA